MSEKEAIRELLRLTRLGMNFAAQEVSSLEARINQDPRMSDTRVAHGMRVMEGEVLFDKATLAVPVGSVLYLADRTYAVFGTSGAPAPSTPTVPAVGADHTLLDGDVHPDTLLGTVVRGDTVYGNSTPKWARLAKPTLASVLINDATDMAYRTIPTTRSQWIWAAEMDNASVAPATYTIYGTDPDCYAAWLMDNAGDYTLIANWALPSDYRSGQVTVEVLWSTTGAVANNWVAYARYLERIDSDSMTAAGTNITATISTNVAANILKLSTIGTFWANSINRVQRLAIRRRAIGDAADNSSTGINIIGIRLYYTPGY